MKTSPVNKEEVMAKTQSSAGGKSHSQVPVLLLPVSAGPGEGLVAAGALAEAMPASHGVSQRRRDTSYNIRLGLTLPESNSLPKLGVSKLTSKLSTKPIFNWQVDRVKMLTERHS